MARHPPRPLDGGRLVLICALSLLAGCQSARSAAWHKRDRVQPGPTPVAEIEKSLRRATVSAKTPQRAAAPGPATGADARIRQVSHEEPVDSNRPLDPPPPTESRPDGNEASTVRPPAEATTPESAADQPLLPPPPALESAEREVFPVDLLTALRLADAQNLTIAIARNRLEIAYAVESAADVLWLPDITFDSSYVLNAGRVQRAIGEIIETRRNSLRLQSGPVLAVDVADAIYLPLVTHQQVHARAAGVEVARNSTLAEVAEAYFDLLAAFSGVSIAVETREHAERLATLTREMVENEVGLPSDAARAQTELQIRRQLETLARAQIVTKSAALARRLQIDPRIQFVPVDPNVVPITVVPVEAQPQGLVDLALDHRPEMAEQRALVDAADWRAERARMQPFIPQLVLGFQAGGFGGGYTGAPDGFFGKFGSRNDFQASVLWDLENLGFGNLYRIRQRELEFDGQRLELRRTMFHVMEEVVSDQKIMQARWEQLEAARRGVQAAVDSYQQNMTRIEGGAGLPIEVLQSIQALQKARVDYLEAVTIFNRSQFELFAAIGYAAVDGLTAESGS